VLAILTCAHSMLESLNIDMFNMLFLDRVIFIRDLNVLILILAGYTSHKILSLIKQFFLSPMSILMPACGTGLKFDFYHKIF
jgi:hypothetical protein